MLRQCTVRYYGGVGIASLVRLMCVNVICLVVMFLNLFVHLLFSPHEYDQARMCLLCADDPLN